MVDLKYWGVIPVFTLLVLVASLQPWAGNPPRFIPKPPLEPPRQKFLESSDDTEHSATVNVRKIPKVLRQYSARN